MAILPPPPLAGGAASLMSPHRCLNVMSPRQTTLGDWEVMLTP
jgi:hypothetical protein